ncbi:NAD(P)-dependent oxidoreductase [Roseivivax isoporae]|uniref:Epimerase n=1 Tax=Roseivivax isoporae LMG 25204 TaxID=1449351 RepID=X7F7A1_9RHOB|nr:NAD(P)H-binding protein [Roseivivax isoporae]ETX28807.1 epimerase [Roseivivax isoporae LMG 25204]
MAHFLVIGASKGIGLQTVKRGLALGHRIRGFARSAASMDIADPSFAPFPGDATNPEDLKRALDGIDAVILTLGIKESVAMLWKEVTLFSDATRALIPAMEAAGVDRLVCLTGIGTGESVSAFSRIERLGHSVVLGKPYQDKTRQEEMIRASSLRWTFARPVILTNGGFTGRYRVLTNPDEWRLGLISRADVADFLIRAAEDDSLVGAAPVLTR